MMLLHSNTEEGWWFSSYFDMVKKSSYFDMLVRILICFSSGRDGPGLCSGEKKFVFRHVSSYFDMF